MITLEQAFDALVKETILYYKYDDKVKEIVPKVIGTEEHVHNLKHTYRQDDFRSHFDSKKSNKLQQWVVYDTSIVNINDLYLNKQDVIDAIVEQKKEEINALLNNNK